MASLAPAVPRSNAQPRAIAHWLLAVAVLVFFMVVVGGITRLTESGLSITEWKPVSGTIPPLTQREWDTAFSAYRATPEYAQVTAGMSMAAFKFIFFWEYVHRLLGRVIGLAFALPLAWFWLRRAIPQGYHFRLVALLALGALQGAVGWWMVVSGLTERVDVSHYRLAVHLMLALFILGGLVWTALDLDALARDPQASPSRLTLSVAALLAALAVQIMFGAWTAGLNAGHAANDWPLMNGRLVPEVSGSWLMAAANDPHLIHWLHRWWAWVAVAALVVLARMAKRNGEKRASSALHAAAGVQILLGIATVLTGVNIAIAVLHQATAALLVASAAWGAHSSCRQASKHR